jgi:hypothetical protein
VIDCPASRRPGLALRHGVFFVGQSHWVGVS